jgi:phospholipase C
MKISDSIGLFNLTRRGLLKGAAQLGLAATSAMLLPLNVRRALAQTPSKRGSLQDVKHVVVLTQENRSFDHYFGTLAGVGGFEDPEALTMPNGRTVFYQPDADNPKGYLLPFHLDTSASRAQKIPSTSHAWTVQHDSWNGGRMDRWLAFIAKQTVRTDLMSWAITTGQTSRSSSHGQRRSRL